MRNVMFFLGFLWFLNVFTLISIYGTPGLPNSSTNKQTFYDSIITYQQTRFACIIRMVSVI